ncbi:MAG: enoyl-CoA hydratase/isomerase family protein [Alphaproteobacteria bacterium]|nr:MAG: enoyl-CoA hydratase/isomerase family protein [Alphaproteobacteria bacterium]
MSGIRIRTEGRVGRVTLARPEALNALTHEMALALEDALRGWADDPAVTMVLIDAEGERAFCAGGDIQRLYDTGRAGDFAYGRRFWTDEYRLNLLIAEYPKPYVALMQGFTMGGGVGISCHGSHRVVCESSRIAMPECGIGLIPDVGGSYLLARAPGHLGEFLGLTGTRMGPGDAIHAGFADMFVPAERWPALTAALVAEPDPAAVLPRFAEPAPDSPLAARQAEIDAVWCGALDEIREGADPEAAKALARGCPLSLACALETIRAARAGGVREALIREYRFTARCMEHGEFLEGIRAAVIDKDRNPHWQVEATPERVAMMLAPLGEEELKL